MIFTQLGSWADTTAAATYFAGTYTTATNSLLMAFVSNVKATAANTGVLLGLGLNWSSRLKVILLYNV